MDLLVHCVYYMYYKFRTCIYWLNISSTLNEDEMKKFSLNLIPHIR